ncbi:MAG: hypothetical protein LBP22_17055 [Deltaproteobacteria bacterium]|nr:hypothetical protein [Deltaproteobacteria bacterium]
MAGNLWHQSLNSVFIFRARLKPGDYHRPETLRLLISGGCGFTGQRLIFSRRSRRPARAQNIQGLTGISLIFIAAYGTWIQVRAFRNAPDTPGLTAGV